MDELETALGQLLRAVLDQTGHRREDFARQMSELGFRWTGNTVTQVVTGRRTLSLLEVAGLCEVLQKSLAELIPQRQFELPSGSVGTEDVMLALTRGRSAWRTHRQGGLTPDERDLYDQFFPPEHDEVTVKVARSLGVDPMTVMEAASTLWGHSLGQERDRRVEAGPGEAKRALQARRGHATRALIQELQAHLSENGSR